MTQELLLQLSTAVLLLPLLSFLLLIFFGKKLPRQGDVMATSILGLALMTSLGDSLRKADPLSMTSS